MKAPLTVKIVEVLGWAYVAFGVAVLILVEGGFWGCWGIVEPVWAGIWCLAFPIGLPLCLVWALHQGRRGWFLWPHAIVVGFFTLGAVFRGSPPVLIALAVLLVAPVVLLFRPSASQWLREVSASRNDCWWKMTPRLPIALLMGVQFLFMAGGSFLSRSEWYYSCAVRGAVILHAALVVNEQSRKMGEPWVDPSLHKGTKDFLAALVRKYDLENVASASADARWCIAVNPPEDENFPVACTANLNPADLFRPEGDRRRVALECPGCSHRMIPPDECIGFCKKAALVVARNGKLVHVRNGSRPPRMFSQFPDVDTVRYLTPTGVIDVAIGH